jgi:hypothetical protein
LYILNQWQLGVNSGVLRIVENNESATPQNVVDQITNFQVQLVMQDGSIVDSLAATGSWTSIQAVRVTITGQETNAQGQVLTRTLSSDFFPRNILST